MNKNDMLLVRRETLSFLLDGGRCDAAELERLRDTVKQPVKPLVLPARMTGETPSCYGWNACLDEIAKLGLLYTHPVPADPGEVEQLTAEIAELLAERNDLRAELEEELGGWKERCRRLNDEYMGWMRKYGTLRAQLAEAQALLREIHDGALSGFARYSKIEEFLSASTEPSAPVERDERVAFESAYPGLTGCCQWDETTQEYKSGEKGLGWQDGLKATQWLAVWQARAALEHKP